MKYILRTYRETDREQVDALAVAAFAQYSRHYDDWPGFSKKISQMSKLTESAEMIVAEIDGKVVGAVVYVKPNQPKADFFKAEWAVIRMLVVSPDARGQGIGRALTEMCLQYAKRDGVKTVALHTSGIMRVALAMYLKMGFVFHVSAPDIHGVKYGVYVKNLKE